MQHIALGAQCAEPILPCPGQIRSHFRLSILSGLLIFHSCPRGTFACRLRERRSVYLSSSSNDIVAWSRLLAASFTSFRIMSEAVGCICPAVASFGQTGTLASCFGQPSLPDHGTLRHRVTCEDKAWASWVRKRPLSSMTKPTEGSHQDLLIVQAFTRAAIAQFLSKSSSTPGGVCQCVGSCSS